MVPNTQAVCGTAIGGVCVLDMAAYWAGDNTQTQALTGALYYLNNFEQITPLLCIETLTDCLNEGGGYYITSYGVGYWLPQFIMAYEMVRSQMTTLQQQTFTAKILNDLAVWGGVNGSPSTNCTNPSATAVPTATYGLPPTYNGGTTLTALSNSGGGFTATVSSTTGLLVGKYVILAGTAGGVGDGTYRVLTVTDSTHFVFGTGGASGTYTLTGVTIQNISEYATTSAPFFGSTVNTGDWMSFGTYAPHTYKVEEFIDSTHAFLTIFNGYTSQTSSIDTASNDTIYYRPATWAAGNCGWIWAIKHDQYTPRQLSWPNSTSTSYPPDGGQNGDNPSFNLGYSALWGLLESYLSLANDDVNWSTRGALQLVAAYNTWYTYPYTLETTLGTGFHTSGNAYGNMRFNVFMPGVAMAVMNSLVSPPSLLTTSSTWALNILQTTYADTLPNAQRGTMWWGQTSVSGPSFSGGFNNDQSLNGQLMLNSWFQGTPQAAYFQWWLNNYVCTGCGYGTPPGTAPWFIASNLTNAPAWDYLFSDTAYTSTPLTGAGQLTLLQNQTQSGSTGSQMDAVISRASPTPFASRDETLTVLQNFYIPGFVDHQVTQGDSPPYGNYNIYKDYCILCADFNLGGNDPSIDCCITGSDSSGDLTRTNCQCVYIGTGSLYTTGGAIYGQSVGIPFAAGSSDYAYGMADVTHGYDGLGLGVTYGHKHIIDFKKSGQQQFVVDIMDYGTSTGQPKTAYFFYSTVNSIGSTSLSGNILTASQTIGGFVNNSQILTGIISPSPVFVTGGTSLDGDAYALQACPGTGTCDGTNTAMVMAAIHMPVTGTGNTFPTVDAATSDSNHYCPQIHGTSPYLVCIGIGGTTYNSLTFTASVSSAPALLASITPGSYNLTGPSGLVSGSPFTVTIASDSIYATLPTTGPYTLSLTSAGVGVGGITMINSTSINSTSH